MPGWIWTILGIILLVWLVGLLFEVGGAVLNVLLIVAAVVLIIGLLSRARAV